MNIYLALMLLSTFTSAPADSSTLYLSHVRVDIIESMPTRQLWNSTKPNKLEFPNVIVVSRAFDLEARPIDGAWHGCGIIMIGTGDLGIHPVTIRIWTMNSCELTINALENLTPRSEANFNVGLSQKETLEINVTQSLDVYVGGKLVGKIKD